MPAIDGVQHYAIIGEHERYPWKPMPWSGVYNKVLFCDAILGTTIELAKIEKGATFPVHYHPTAQTLFLLTGLIRAGDRTITPGTFDVIPAGERHGGYYAEADSIQYKFFSSMPVYFMETGEVFYYRTDGTVEKLELNTQTLSAQNIMAARH